MSTGTIVVLGIFALGWICGFGVGIGERLRQQLMDWLRGRLR